jgi:hypothetical protein
MPEKKCQAEPEEKQSLSRYHSTKTVPQRTIASVIPRGGEGGGWGWGGVEGVYLPVFGARGEEWEEEEGSFKLKRVYRADADLNVFCHEVLVK